MATIEGIRLKILKIIRKNKYLISKRRKKLVTTDFTIISNNCWGGMIYETYGLPKLSPTIGLFFMASDYIIFLKDLKGYSTGDIKFIKPEESKWVNDSLISGDSRFGSYPIGVLSNGKEELEVFFLHYNSENEAKDKWKRRCKRINWDKMLIKFNDQNGCTEKELNDFINLPYKNKIFFTCKTWGIKSEIIKKIYQPFNRKFIRTSYEPYGKNNKIDINDIINYL